MSAVAEAATSRILHAIRARPLVFVRQLLGVVPEPWQAKALRAVGRQDRVAIRSGHGVGKTALLAWTVLWWLLSRRPAKAACTAPTRHQLEDVLWAELARWRQRLPPGLRERLLWTRDRLMLGGGRGDNFAVARTARAEQPEALQGFHERHMLLVVDEASGVPEPVFEAGQGTMSGAGAKTLLAGNPTRSSGFFHDVFHRGRIGWMTMKVACSDSSLVRPGFIADMAERYGAESDVFRVRVLGEFPRREDDVLIPLELVEAALARDVPGEGRIVWGLDVARRGGDRTALARRQGSRLLAPVEWWRGADTMQTAGRVAAAFETLPPAERPHSILVDAIGIGAGVADRLGELGLPAIGINVAARPARRGGFVRLRDELWHRAREWFQDGDACLPPDNELIAELTDVRFRETSSGKIQVENKPALRARRQASPDLADAFVLTFADGEGSRGWNGPTPVAPAGSIA